MNRVTALSVVTLLTLSAGCADDSTTTTTEAGKSTTSTEGKQDPAKETSPKPFNASSLLGGDAKPSLPAGSPGKVAVIAQAPIDIDKDFGAATLVFAFRNNTGKAISHVDWTATARAAGNLVATGESQGTQPAWVAPGEIGLAYIYFDAGENIPSTGATYEFKPETSEADTESFNTAPLAVGEANRTARKIVGSATNKTGKKLIGPYSVGTYCFDGSNLTAQSVDYASEDGDIAPGDTVHFTVDLFDKPCKTYALGVSGYFS